ncbi:MAG: energy-coupling factor transporter transmembrane protein EcfT [Candidatus Eremiobacteraeota bacterium]|nr:energy-coupling factor transporter transmembrane protein EcfT [Candidatus Eremiobacteraeota bacterium]
MELMRNVTIGQYVPGSSALHRLDPRVKILLLMLMVLQIFLISQWWLIFLPFLFFLAVTAVSGLTFRYVLRGLRAVVMLVLITFLFNVFLTPGHPLWTFWCFTVTYEGFTFGLLMAMRLILIVLATSLLTLTTSPIQITDALEDLMKWGKPLRIPVHEVAMMMSIALRFIPTLMEQLEKIIKAQMARGADFERGSLIERVKSFIPILVPLFVQAFRHADELAVAMEARCYRGGEGRTRLRILKMGLNDFTAVALTGAFCILLCFVDGMKIRGL